MVLENWKKIQDLPYWIQWVNKEETIQVNILKLTKGYSVDIGKIPYGSIIDKKFKTKSQAMVYAKSYMRTH